MCGVIVVDAGRSRSTWHERDAYIHNHCLGYHHNFALFYQLLDSNLFTHRMFSFKREASSETYIWPGSIFRHIFQIYKPRNPKVFYILFSSIYLYQISPLQVTVKGLTTPLSRWVQVCLIVCVGIRWLVCCLLLDWYLGSQTEGNSYSTLLHHPFLFKGKNNASSRGSRKNF